MAKNHKHLLPPIHTGEILTEGVHETARIEHQPGRSRFARAGYAHRRNRPLPAKCHPWALRLARCFGTTPGFWINLQSAHDLEIAEREGMKNIGRDVHPLSSVA